jgi:DHA1 family inner membrane transport protein
MGQINTLSSAVSVVFALLMGVLSVRFRHKSLLLAGLVALSGSAVGCFFAWDLNSAFAAYALSGVGIAMVGPMCFALVGEHLALSKRAGAVGQIVAGGSLAYLVGAPIMGVLADFGGWRTSLLGFVMPFSLVSLLLAFVGVPTKPSGDQASCEKHTYVEGLREIVSHRSPIGCLVGNVLRNAAFAAVLFYSAAFFIERFALPEGIASFVILGAALSYTLGSVASGWFVNRHGRKPSTVLTALLAGLFTMSYAFPPDPWLSFILLAVATWFSGMVATSASSLTLEQVPEFRGSMMSMGSVATSLGSVVGASVGGVALIYFDYEVLGGILGGMGIIAAVVFQLLTTDPAGHEDSRQS